MSSSSPHSVYNITPADYSKRKCGDGHGRSLGVTKPALSKPGFVQLTQDFSGLRRHFLFPPFSVLRAMDGEWQRRKRQWLALGIKSEVGRGVVTWKIGPDGKSTYSDDLYTDGARRKYGKKLPAGISGRCEGGGYSINADECSGGDTEAGRGTSIFDPVLSELIYRWFCPANGQVIDPFAGGSVRGIVAHVLGYRYWGSELRQEQVEANEQQGGEILPENRPTWLCGDALNLVPNAPEADLIFTCPPYGYLEVYSELPEDLSNMEYPKFREVYAEIVRLSVAKLRDNRFACVVVGDFRDKQGFYHNFVGDTVRCFRRAGMGFYNEAILVTAAGSLPIRITKQFQSGRKMGKTHQNVLVFYKGDPKKIKTVFGEIER